jgi:hypothetical protein
MRTALRAAIDICPINDRVKVLEQSLQNILGRETRAHERHDKELDRLEQALAKVQAERDAIAQAKGFDSFEMGEMVEKKSGSNWHGRVVGFYSTSLTGEGYAIESVNEPGSVQIYPAKALRSVRRG